jgi:Icc-related predicted phosphoesterase
LCDTREGEAGVTPCLFCSDLHGQPDRYERLFRAIESERPAGVFLGGDLLPGLAAAAREGAAPYGDFVEDTLAAGLASLRRCLGVEYPRVFVILGNDDGRAVEPAFEEVEARGLWSYAHGRRLGFSGFDVYGYSFMPPSPFLLKDWERYDVSRYVDPGCVSPESGHRSVAVEPREARLATIQQDLDRLTADADLSRAVLLFHAPPYRTRLDRAALDGRLVDHVPLDVHVGSIAVRRFIEARQPRLTLHGHVHESARLTGSWQDRIDRTLMLSAAHDGPELALVRFDLDRPENASRELLR